VIDGRLRSRTLPAGSTTATTGEAGSRHDALPEVLTTTSAPRLPAAPPSGPAVATMSDFVHCPMAGLAADVGVAWVGAVDGAAVLVADGTASLASVGLAILDGDGLGPVVPPQAARSVPIIASAAMRGYERWRWGLVGDAIMRFGPARSGARNLDPVARS
jgi:hypothetical protein